MLDDVLDALGEKSATLSELLQRMSGPDWTGRVGELVKVFVRFDSLKATKSAYKQLFGDQAINDILNSDAVALACLVRNQITHDSGLVTTKFVRQAADWNADPWKSAVVGERLPLNGRSAAALCDGLIDSANNLIRAVDLWLHLPPSAPITK